MSEDRRVVITGLGVVTPIGTGVETFWKALLDGKNGAKTVKHFDTDGIAAKFAAWIDDFNPADHFDPKEARKNERFTQFAMVAAREAMKDSGLIVSEANRDRIGTLIGCGIGGLQTIEEQHEILRTKGAKRISPFLIPKIISNMSSGMVSIDHGLRGPSSCVVTACATGTHAIGDAWHIIRRGEADAMVAGGTEAAITPLGLGGFSNMHALSTRNDDPKRASRPFDRERDGFIMGEGAGILVLEELECARARGARIYAEMAGYGMSADAYHITAPDPGGDGGARCLRAALDSGRLNPADIDYINAHGTSTPLNDKIETLAIKTVFGDHSRRLAISSIKSMVGHLLGAAGGVEGVATALTILRGVIPPTTNYEFPDPECDLDYVPNTPREARVDIALSSSLGFGGHNCAIIMKRFEG
ncbi:beta-ketoacyl-ACP synthase II [Candidatus Sumerlaeota bacterium]|nr:beta-ketoacyl-ACP synthase II [Candidatus Sumerlaeota bacterium]